MAVKWRKLTLATHLTMTTWPLFMTHLEFRRNCAFRCSHTLAFFLNESVFCEWTGEVNKWPTHRDSGCLLEVYLKDQSVFRTRTKMCFIYFSFEIWFCQLLLFFCLKWSCSFHSCVHYLNAGYLWDSGVAADDVGCRGSTSSGEKWRTQSTEERTKQNTGLEAQSEDL